VYSNTRRRLAQLREPNPLVLPYACVSPMPCQCVDLAAVLVDRKRVISRSLPAATDYAAGGEGLDIPSVFRAARLGAYRSL
jgi:hypothetical protein